MYYRMSTYKIQPGKEAEFFEIADRLRPTMKAIPGIQHIHGVKLSEDSYVTVAVYDIVTNPSSQVLQDRLASFRKYRIKHHRRDIHRTDRKAFEQFRQRVVVVDIGM